MKWFNEKLKRFLYLVRWRDEVQVPIKIPSLEYYYMRQRRTRECDAPRQKRLRGISLIHLTLLYGANHLNCNHLILLFIFRIKGLKRFKFIRKLLKLKMKSPDVANYSTSLLLCLIIILMIIIVIIITNSIG